MNATTSETMTVRVRDRSAEGTWGYGPQRVATREVTISTYCPKDGQRRGEPTGRNSYLDGIHYWVQIWTNPCGHLDAYENIIAEARERGTLGPVTLR